LGVFVRKLAGGTIARKLAGLLVSVVSLVMLVGVGLAAGGPRASAGSDDARWVRGPAVARELAQLEREREFRESARGRAERSASRSAFAGLGDEDAARLMRRSFPRLFGEEGRRLALGRGEHVTRFENDNTAVIEDADGRKSLAYSPLPLAVRDGSGGRSPVNLTPVKGAHGWRARNSPTPVTLGTDVGDGIVLGGSGISLKPAFAKETTGTAVAGDVFYANVDTDTDFKAAPSATGASFALQLRSPSSPQSFDFTVDLPAGARLEARHEPAPQVRVVRGTDEVLMTLSPPIAFDVQGAPVATDYDVAGNVVSLRVPHRAHDFAYPIAVDPTTSDSFNWETGGETNYNGWQTRDANWGHHYATGNQGWGAGLNVWNDPWTGYPWGTFGMWFFQARGDSYIYKANLSNLTFWDMNPGNACVQAGIGIAWSNWEGSEWVSCSGGEYGTTTSGPVIVPYGGTAAGTPGNVLAFALSNGSATGPNADLVQLGTMTVYYGDDSRPTIRPDTSTTSGWIEGTSTRTVSVLPHDSGVGVKSHGLRVPQNSGTPLDMPLTQYSCSGHVWFCYQNDPSTNRSYTVNFNNVPEGKPIFKAMAADGLDNRTAAVDYGPQPDGANNWEMRVDRSAPTLSDYTGDLAPGGVGWVKGGTHTLGFKATDPNAGVNQTSVAITNSVVGTDSFNRTTSNGWGNAVSGQPWMSDGSPDSAFTTNGLQGTVTLPNDSAWGRRLQGFTARDIDATLQANFAAPTPATGETLAYFSVRDQSPAANVSYKLRLVRDAAGRILLRAVNFSSTPVGPDVDTGLRYTPGAQYYFRVQVTGASPTTIKLKAWPVGQAEPSGWAFSQTDSTIGPQIAGNVLIGGKHTSGLPSLTIALDNFSVTDLGTHRYPLVDNQCTTVQGCPSPATTAFTWDTTNEAEGLHTFTANAVDPFATNQPSDPRHAVISTAWAVGVDRTAPNLTSVSGDITQAGGFVGSGQHVVHAVATDAVSGFATFQLKIDGSLVESVPANCSADCSSASADLHWNAADSEEGLYDVEVIALDKAGNPASRANTFYKDGDSPETGATGDLWDSDGRTLRQGSYALDIDSVDGDPTDPESGVKSVEVEVDEVRAFYREQTCAATSCPLSTQWAFDPTQYEVGDHTIDVTVTDQLGNSDAEEMNVTVERAQNLASQTIDMGTRSGTRIDGAATGDRAGQAVAAIGDVNGDGYDDYAIGAPRATTDPARPRAGAVYVVYGSEAGADADLTSFDPIRPEHSFVRGFRITGAAANDLLGTAVSPAGDVNGDDIADFVIGAPRYDASLVPAPIGFRGSVYVIFGQLQGSDLEIASLYDQGRGYEVLGPQQTGSLLPPAGGPELRTFGSVLGGVNPGDFEAAGDVNDDGLDDIVIGSSEEAAGTNSRAGVAYVAFGKSDTGSLYAPDITDDAHGFRIVGAAANDQLGYSAAMVGYVNDDEFQDIIVGAPGAQRTGRSTPGAAYVIYGKADTGTVSTGALGGRGSTILGGTGDRLGVSAASAGDVDGDDVDDLAVGGHGAYVIYGPSAPQTIDLGQAGVSGYHVAPPTGLGYDFARIANAGDVNNDAIPDLLLGFPQATPTSLVNGGAAYVVYGQQVIGDAPPPEVSVSTMPGQAGTRLIGGSGGDGLGSAVDNVDTGPGDETAFLVGAPGASNTPKSKAQTGSAYVVMSSEMSGGNTAEAHAAEAKSKCHQKRSEYLYHGPAELKPCRKSLKDRKDERLDKKNPGNSRRSVSRLDPGHLWDVRDSFGDTFAQIEFARGKHNRRIYRLYGPNGDLKKTIPWDKKRVRLQGRACMSTSALEADNALILFDAHGRDSNGNDTSPYSLRGFIKRAAIPNGSFNRGRAFPTNDSVIESKRYRVKCGKPSRRYHNEKSATPTAFSTQPFTADHLYQGKTTGDREFSNGTRRCKKADGGVNWWRCGSSYVNYFRPLTTNYNGEKVLEITSATTGVAGGGIVRAVIRTPERKVKRLDSIDYLDKNVPCTRQFVAHWVFVRANPAGRRMYGWLPEFDSTGSHRGPGPNHPECAMQPKN
jgi:hypothetical protein